MAKDPSTRPQLPRGSHALAREDVLRIHGGRLRQGMIDAVDERGYLDTRIADVIQYAGVARNAFYAQFTSKEECFLATREAISERALADLRAALGAAPSDDAAATLDAFVTTLLGAAAAHPKEARLLLVDVLAIGAHGPAHRRRTRAQLDELLAPRLGAAVPPVARTAIVGGVLQTVAARLHRRAARDLPRLAPDLVAWARAYAASAPADAPPAPEAPSADDHAHPPVPGEAHRLPSGRHRLPHSVVAHSQRERILEAVVVVSATGGYAGLTVPAISTAAGVSHQTFYEHFTDKQGAFLAAVASAQSQTFAAARNRFATQTEWPAAVAAAMEGWTAYLAADPAVAKFCFNDALSGGLEAQQHIDAAQFGFAELLTPGLDVTPPGGAVPPALAPAASVGALWTLVEDHVATGAASSLSQLAPALTYVALTPFVGAATARRAAVPAG